MWINSRRKERGNHKVQENEIDTRKQAHTTQRDVSMADQTMRKKKKTKSDDDMEWT